METLLRHDYFVFIVMILLSYIVLSEGLCNDCLVQYSPAFDNLAVSDHRIWTRTAPHQQFCFRLCRLETSCLSFEFNRNTNSCRGYASTFASPNLVSTSTNNGNKRYTMCPDYLGCFKDNRIRLLPYSKIRRTDMNTEVCKEHCRRRGYRVAGTEDSEECYCGHSVPAALRSEDSKCNMRCPGNISQMCGGVWFLSAYRT